MPRIRWFAAIVVILAVVGCLFLYAYLLRKRAESLVRSAYELSNYKSGPLTSAVLKKQYGSSLKTLQGLYAFVLRV